MTRTTQLIDQTPPIRVVVALVAAAVVGVTVGDYATGPYLVFAAFYFLPVMAASWYLGIGAGAATAAVAAAGGAASTALDPGEVTGWIICWNAVARTVTYGTVAWLVHAVRQSLSEVHELASTDGLTGLANRRRFLEEVDAEVARAIRDQTVVSLAYLDLDGLKQRNDTQGHDAGDAMLSQFSQIARKIVRVTDIVGRLGGDEFCILMRRSDRGAAEIAMRRLYEGFAAADPPIGVSAGVVTAWLTAATTGAAIVDAADVLMLEAKHSGKGHWLVATFPAGEVSDAER